MTKNRYNTVLSIAGSDSSGGAGIQADIKTISALDCYAATVITALTAQNTQGVQAIQTLPPQFITQQAESVFTDLNINAVKIGMLHDADVIDSVSKIIQSYQPEHVILDPVMIAQDGSTLLKPETIKHLKTTLLPLATIITPNIPEAIQLSQQKISHHSDMEHCARTIGQYAKTNVLLKGGHHKQESADDVFYCYQLDSCSWYSSPWVDTHNTHGTGCTLSSAIAALLAKDFSLPAAIQQAKHYITQALKSGANYRLGTGHGPVHHFYQQQ